MIQLNILLKNSSITLPLYFKAYKKADEVRKIIINRPLLHKEDIEDDYGSIFTVTGSRDEITGVVLVDLYKEMDRQGEFSVMQTIAQQKAQQHYQATAGSKILKPVGALPSVN